MARLAIQGHLESAGTVLAAYPVCVRHSIGVCSSAMNINDQSTSSTKFQIVPTLVLEAARNRPPLSIVSRVPVSLTSSQTIASIHLPTLKGR
jgi:hypothetical protein